MWRKGVTCVLQLDEVTWLNCFYTRRIVNRLPDLVVLCRKYYLESASGDTYNPSPCYEFVSTDQKNDSAHEDSVHGSEVETEQAAAMLWGLKCSEIGSIQGEYLVMHPLTVNIM